MMGIFIDTVEHIQHNFKPGAAHSYLDGKDADRPSDDSYPNPTKNY